MQRCTKDKSRPNKFGRRLIELCQNCSLYIANSRIFKDKGIGKCTCKDATVVDYLIISSNVFPLLSEFEIIDFNPLTSDVHNRIHFCINSSRELEKSVDSDQVRSDGKFVKWDARKQDNFLQFVLDDPHNKLSDILSQFDLLTNENITESDINEVVQKLSNLFTSSAASTFGVKSTCNKNR